MDVLYGNDSSYLTPEAKADKVLLIENDASEKFKETFVSRYNALQSELIKRTKSIRSPKQFGQATLDLDAILGAGGTLKELAKELP
jgi:hypothetical protein